MNLRRKTYDEQLTEIRERYGPPPMQKTECDICGQPANTEITWYFRPSELTGARTIKAFCDDHGRDAHNAIAHLFDWNYVEEPTT